MEYRKLGTSDLEVLYAGRLNNRVLPWPLVGARNAQQAVESAKAIEIKLDNKELNFITEELDQLRLVTE